MKNEMRKKIMEGLRKEGKLTPKKEFNLWIGYDAGLCIDDTHVSYEYFDDYTSSNQRCFDEDIIYRYPHLKGLVNLGLKILKEENN